MARLVIHPKSAAPGELRLKPGANSIGRDAGNDIHIPDPSVSSSHCQILVSDESATIRDLGSTNGTFINRDPVREALLQTGQTIHLGNVEMMFYADGPPAVTVRQAPPVPMPVTAPVNSPALAVAAPATLAVAQPCRFHPKSPARFWCDGCRQFFCEFCVACRSAGGVQQSFCRHCGATCVPVQAQFKAVVPKSFFQRLPGAFVYPLRGAGVFVVVVGIALLGMLKGGQILMRLGTIRTFLFGIILEIAAGGYLFTYLQCIIHSTTAEDRELPELPGIGNFIEDLLLPFLRLLGLTLFCFGPALALLIWIVATHQTAFVWAIIAATILGYLYFPMALLAVAILDSVAAANPLVVVPSMLKTPLEYLVALILLVIVFGFQAVGDFLTAKLLPDGWGTQSMGELVAIFGTTVFTSFTTLYLLVVAVHALGLIYVARKTDLGWLER